MIYSDEDIRSAMIALWTAPTERDRQVRIGASNMSNQCNRCLAFEMLGQERTSALLDRVWMGARLGTAIHGYSEGRLNEFLATDEKRRFLQEIIGLSPDARAETHTFFAELRGYGPVGGTIDIEFSHDHIGDLKGSTRKKIALIRDYLAIQAGNEPIFGRKHASVKLSEKEYDKEMAAIAYKITGYYGQTNLYMHGKHAHRSSLIFIARDGTGYYDTPTAAGFNDSTKQHDIFVLSFDYDPAYAEWLIARAQSIWDALSAGKKPGEFESHEHCFVCENEDDSIADVPAREVQYPVPAAA